MRSEAPSCDGALHRGQEQKKADRSRSAFSAHITQLLPEYVAYGVGCLADFRLNFASDSFGGAFRLRRLVARDLADCFLNGAGHLFRCAFNPILFHDVFPLESLR
jgi:hypothetical protein